MAEYMEENGMKRRITVILLICSMIFSLAACGKKKTDSSENQAARQTSRVEQTEVPGQKSTAILKIGFSTDVSDPRVQSAELFRDLVEEQTQGRIQVELHANGELGSDTELIQGVMGSNLDMTVSSAGNFANYASNVGVSAFPFLFSDFEKAWDFIDGKRQQEIEKDLEEYNIKVLAHFDNGFRCVTTSKEAGPIQSVADMQGLKIRTPENQIVMETLSALGANPHVLGFAQLYDALEQGEYDAQENPIPIIYNHKLYKVQENLAITNHSYDAMLFVIRHDLWEEFAEEDQLIIRASAIEAQQHNRQLIQEQTREYLQKLEKKGMKITYPDLEEFKEATAKVYDEFSSSYGKELMESLKNQ